MHVTKHSISSHPAQIPPVILDRGALVNNAKDNLQALQVRLSSLSTRVSVLDPTVDPRWSRFLAAHPRASVFHSPAWLEVIRATYGYQPLVFTTAGAGEELSNGAVFSIVRSWLVGPRLVSLPFSDHVDPLVDSQEDLCALLDAFEKGQQAGLWKSVELRPPCTSSTESHWGDFHEGQRFALHQVDLTPDLDTVFSRFHKDSIQRRIRKAEREGVKYLEGRSEKLLADFFRLMVLTRKRLSVPPPPLSWFRNVIEHLGEDATIRVARYQGHPVAAVLSLLYKQTAVYKYGCTDDRYHKLGAMPFLFWKMIQDAKHYGAQSLDLGRSDLYNQGLITFKEKFGATRSDLVYRKYPGSRGPAAENWKLRTAKRVFHLLPHSLLTRAGEIIYPHIG